MPEIADRIIEELTPAHTQEDSLTFVRVFVETLVAGLEEPSEWTHDEPGYALLVDPTRAPVRTLDWLAQFVGVRFLGDVPDTATRRQQIVDRPLWRRGQASHIRTITQETLIGTQDVRLTERPGDNAYRLGVRTFAVETPSSIETELAIRSVLPSGIILNLTVLDFLQDYADLRTNNATYTAVSAGFATYDDVRNNNPI